MHFDLVDLRLFLLVAESGSITHGAERASLALASASARIKGMENRLGTPLLLRQRRGISLTPAGQALVHHARAVQNQIEAMAGDLGAFARGMRARVRLLGNTAATGDLLTEILPGFLVAHPQIDIDLDERPSHMIAELIASGAADLGIAAADLDLVHLEQRPFRTDCLTLIAPPDWPGLAGAHGATLDQLLGQGSGAPFVGLRAGSPLQEYVTRQAARLGIHLQYRIRVPTIEDVCQLVAQGVSIAIVPERAARRSSAHRKLCKIVLRDSWATRRLTLHARRFEDLTPQARLLATVLAPPGSFG